MKKSICLIFVLFVYGCGTLPPPKDPNSVCNIFKQRQKWYWAAQSSEKRWGTPIAVQMAILHQESHFDAKARPARTKLLWIIPWKRPSTAYGYSQALNNTWKNYRKAVGRSCDRKNFNDSIDFVSWYGEQARAKAGLNKADAYSLYLAYHEGIGGYMRGTHMKKDWLLGVANKVQRRSSHYQRQLDECSNSLPTKPWYCFWC